MVNTGEIWTKLDINEKDDLAESSALSLFNTNNPGADTGFIPGGGDFLKSYIQGGLCTTVYTDHVLASPQNDHFKLLFFRFQTHFIHFWPCICIIILQV